MSVEDEQFIRPGEVLLGKYRVEKILGRGGMGLVVSARHLSLDDRVAIKVLLPKCLTKPDLVQRFLREARAAVRIRSQHVARVSDVGTLEGGLPYMVMEHLEGKDLSGVLEERGPLPIPVAIDFVLQACEALAEAHTLGIVHRDIKPGNLFLTHHADGTPCVKVLDFGISKVAEPEEHTLTQAGGMLGSPLYMSPEQLTSARDVDVRADVYSMGIVLFELLTQSCPFGADDLPRLFFKVLQAERPSPRETRPDIAPGLEHAILTAIARERERRFGTVADFALALAPFGTSYAQASLERICGVLGVRGRPPHPHVTTANPAAPPVHQASHVSTISAAITPFELGAPPGPAGATSPASPKRGTPVAVAVGVGAGLVVGSLALWGLIGRSHHGAPDLAAATHAPPARAEEALLPVAAPAAVPSAVASSSVAPIASASAVAATPVEEAPVAKKEPAAKSAKPSGSSRATTPAKSAKPADPFKRDIF